MSEPRPSASSPTSRTAATVLLVEPTEPLDRGRWRRSQAALKNAIQVEFQLEDDELAAEPLPDRDDRRDCSCSTKRPRAAPACCAASSTSRTRSPRVAARGAASSATSTPTPARTVGRAPGATEDCEAACYDCLLSYGNQPDHRAARPHSDAAILLLSSPTPTVEPSPASRRRRDEHLERLRALADSELEQRLARPPRRATAPTARPTASS